MDNRWQLKSFDKNKTDKLQEVLGVHSVICQLLVQRGFDSYNKAKDFFRMSLDQLHNPFLMLGMDIAVERIQKAIETNQKILIYGDYDVDGTTSVSLVYSYFSNFYDRIYFYIPDRHSEGYGVSFKGIDYAEENNIPLIIALDCGTKAIDKIEYANKKSIDLLFATIIHQEKNCPIV